MALVAGGLDVDLVILDRHMPGLSDTQTLAKLRESRPGLPVVLASGSPDAQLEAQAARLGGVTFLAKPYRLRISRRCWARPGRLRAPDLQGAIRARTCTGGPSRITTGLRCRARMRRCMRFRSATAACGSL